MTHLNTARIHLRKAKVLGVDPCTLKDIMLLGVLKHLFGALKALRSLKNSKKTPIFILWLPIARPPGGQIQIQFGYSVWLGLNSLPSEFHLNLPTLRATWSETCELV